MSLSVLFAGTPAFALPSLNAIHAAGHRIAAVYTQPDRPAGRGKKLTAPAAKQRALELGLAVEQPASLKSDDVLARMREHNADIIVVVAYGLLLPKLVLELAPLGCINLHPSLLPRWRGAAPIQRPLLAGDATTGVTIMEMTEGLDSGPILLQREHPISPDVTAGQLHDQLATSGAQAMVDTLAAIERGERNPKPQDDSKATYADKLTKAEARIDWQEPATVIARQVRGYNPWPVAHCTLADAALRVWQASSNTAKTSAAPGTIVETSAQGIHVATGNGVLLIEQLQPPGKRQMPARDFINANPDLAGKQLG